MAYFANGTDGMIYEEKYCDHCLHFGDEDGIEGCPILLIHDLYNYDQCKPRSTVEKTIKEILELLIPTMDSYPDKCKMFIDDGYIETSEAKMESLRDDLRRQGK